MALPALAWFAFPAKALISDKTLAERWDELNDLRGGVPVLTSTMIATAAEFLGDGLERLIIGRCEGRIAAMLVLQPAGRFRWQTFQPSQLPLGPWVAEPGLRLEDLTRSLCRSTVLGPKILIATTQIDPRVAARTQDAGDMLTLDYVDTGWIDITGSIEDYWAQRGKNLRQNLRKQRNRLAADGVVPQMRVLNTPDAMADAVARYGALEGKGWKAAEGTAILPDNVQGRFYTRLLERGAARGEAEIYEYWFADRLVASNLAIRHRRTMVVLKTTYDEAERNTSPAFLLREEELRHLFQEGRIDRLEFYGRMMEWHTRWTESSVRLHHVTAYRWAWLKTLAQRLGDRRRREAAASSQSEPATSSAA